MFNDLPPPAGAIPSLSEHPPQPREVQLDDDMDGDQEELEGVPLGEEMAMAPAELEEHQQSDSGVDHDDVEDVAWPENIAGSRLVAEDKVGRHGALHRGFRVACSFHGWPCRKFRSIAKHTDRYGPRACLYFLGAWLEGAASHPAGSHTGWEPSAAQIRAFIQQYEG